MTTCKNQCTTTDQPFLPLRRIPFSLPWPWWRELVFILGNTLASTRHLTHVVYFALGLDDSLDVH